MESSARPTTDSKRMREGVLAWAEKEAARLCAHEWPRRDPGGWRKCTSWRSSVLKTLGPFAAATPAPDAIMRRVLEIWGGMPEGPLWRRRLASPRELALLAVLAGWHSNKWREHVDVAPAFRLAWDVARKRRGLGKWTPPAFQRGRPKKKNDP